VLQIRAAGLLVGHVPRQGDHGNPAAAERFLDRDLGDPWQLLGIWAASASTAPCCGGRRTGR
jgi:hypothetical protein